jgi:hypothetical protein
MVDEENKIFVISNGQRGGITANQVNINTKSPRQLTNNFKIELGACLKKFKDKTITITAIQGDAENYSFAEQIKNQLDSTGFKTSGINIFMSLSKPQKGVVIDPNTGAITVWGQ